MRKLLPIFCCLLIIFSCKKEKKSEPVPQTEAEKFTEQIEKREDFKTPEALPIQDTTSVLGKHVEVKDKHLQERILKETDEFYKRTNYKTRWVYSNDKAPLLESYLKVLKNSEAYGFNPKTYRINELSNLNKLLIEGELNLQQKQQLDKQATASFLLFTIHLSEGRIFEPEFENRIWRKSPAETDEVDLLAKLKTQDDFDLAVESLQPQFAQYKRMQKRLAELKTEKDDSLAQFSFTNIKKFKVGYTDDDILLLRENLLKRGFTTDTISNQVDDNLLEAIQLFQESRNLEADGLPGAHTLYYLNMTPAVEQKLLILNMERMRWIDSENFGNEFILVNIPEFKLFMFKDKKLQFDMNVIVGKQYTPTPVFADQLEYIEFRPTWNVPQSIIKNEMIPLMAADPLRYTRQGFAIYEHGVEIDPATVDWGSPEINSRYFNFVEKPSPRNALGLVKFIFPNNLSIYLHDTPTHHLFARQQRAMSHGCVRVSEPAKLATFLLEDNPEWNREKVEEAMNSGPEKQRVYLDKDVAVQLLYITAYVDENKKLVLSNDIYGFDKQHLAILEQEFGK